MLALTVGVASATSGVAKNGPPLIDLQGSSYTQTTLPIGVNQVVVGELDFSIDARKLRNGSMKGTLNFQDYNCLTDGSFDPLCSGPDKTLHQVAHQDAKIACLTADAATRTVWFSAQVKGLDDQRIPAELLQKEQGILAQGKLIVIGRFRERRRRRYR